MGYDLDPLDDIFADEAVENARAVGKFQPKSKFRPQRKGSATNPVASSQAVQSNDCASSELSKPIELAKPLEKCSTVVPNVNADRHTLMKKSVGENADIFTGLDVLGDILPHTTTDMVSECSDPPPAAVAVNLSNPENTEGLVSPILSSVEDSTHTCKVDDVPTDPGLSAEVDPMTAAEPIVSSADVHDDVHNKELGREENSFMDSINMTELTTTKSEKDSIPTFQQDDVLDLSSLGFTHTLPTEETSELPLNEESITLMEMAQSDSCTHPEGLPKIPAKLASRRAKTGSSKNQAASDPSTQQQKDSILSQENVTRRSLRPRKGKTTFCELVDEDIDEVLATKGNSEECPLSSAIEVENINNEEFQVQNESHKKKLKWKSKTTDDGKEKPAKRKKKAKEATDQEGAKHKKFSHSTRRRQVDQTLLETPEEEIDYSKVPFRDLIILAEHREKKEKAAAGAPATNQSIGDSSGLNNDENFTSEQSGKYNDGQRGPEVEDTTINFNYQTFMEKEYSKRWSKQETELFYEAVRQFGTDLSMIQMRFPHRSRRQIKLKYKKEERQHPLRLREALTNRTKDLSHYHEVIEHLRRIAAEENQNADDGDDLIDLADNGGADEGTPNADDNEVKDVRNEEEENENVANDFAEGQSPLKSDGADEEDDFLRWSQYKSDI